MSYFGNTEWYQRVTAGLVPKHSIFSALGERENVGITTEGEDIWLGSSASIPIPPDAGEQMSVVSSDGGDDISGAGIREVRVHYLDSTGTPRTEDIELTGTTPVIIQETNLRFINDIYAIQVGSNSVAVGDITVHKTGTPATIYNMIAAGGNKSLVPSRMIPLGHTLSLIGWQAAEAQGERQSVRIRSTDMYGVLIPGVFCFKDSVYLNQTVTGNLALYERIPALSIIKVSSWALVAGGEVNCSWWGVLIED